MNTPRRDPKKSWLQTLQDLVPVQMLSIMLLNEDEELEVVADLGFRQPPDLVLPIGTGLAGRAVETGEPVVANDAPGHTHFVESEYNTRQLLVVPLFDRENHPMGTVNLSNPTGFNKFEDKHVETVERFVRDNPPPVET